MLDADFLELRACEVRRIPLPRTPVNRASLDAPGSSGWHDAYGEEEVRNVTTEIDTGGFRMVLGDG
jgi:hypothetical protein